MYTRRRANFEARIACLVAFAIVAGAPLAAVGLEVGEVVRKVQERYDGTLDFTAALTQETMVASLGKTVTSSGTIAFKKPGKMRLEITEGDPQTVVADGSTLWLYQPAENQVLKAPFKAAFRSSTPISFLSGVGRIADDFDAKLDGEGDGVLYLLLTPRQGGGDVGKLRLTIARPTFEIQGAEIHDPLGNINRLRFRDIRPNSGIADSRFVFDVPDGVDVIAAPATE